MESEAGTTTTTAKKSSFSSCRAKELKQAAKMADMGKLYKKVERLGRRILHGERTQSTFVPSTQQNSTQISSSGSNDHQMPHQPVIVNPPYPVHPAFGTGFPQFPYPQQSQVQHVPPSYGWALHSNSPGTPIPQPNFGALSLDVGVGNETAGSGYDHLAVHHDEENHPTIHSRGNELANHINAQSTKLEHVKARSMNEMCDLNQLTNDVSQLENYFYEKYPFLQVKDESMTTDRLEEKVKHLEETLRRLRALSPKGGGPPPRPPPPRSISQENSTGLWLCDRCSFENRCNSYRCKSCHLPSRHFDPSEIDFCRCEYCLPHTSTN